MENIDPEKIAKRVTEFICKTNECVFLTSDDPKPDEPFTMQKLFDAKKKLEALGPFPIEMRFPINVLCRIKEACRPEPQPLGSFMGLNGGMSLNYDLGLKNEYIVEYSDGSRDVKWIGPKEPHDFFMN